jgi:TIGR02453 family protein
MKELNPFTGFTAESASFLKELKENNYREWFNERKHVYEEALLQPFRSLAAMLSPAMYNIDPQFELRPSKMLSRIYRDIRFSPNKDPYKTSMWLNFQRSTTHWEDFPGYFAELTNEHFMYGMGLFMPKRKIMDYFREEIEYSQDSFREMAEQALQAGFEVAGEEYKRPLPNTLPAFYQPWMQRKSAYVIKTLPLSDERIYSEAIALQLINDFSQIADLYRFMIDIAKEAGN